MTLEELAMDGSVSLSRCSVITLYKWYKAINVYLERDHFDWRVKSNRKDMTIDVKED